MEENVRVAVQTFQQPIGGVGGPKHWAWNSTADVITVRTPDGQFDDIVKALSPIMASGGYTTEWQQRLAKALADDNARTMAWIKKRGEDTAQMMKKNHEAYMAASKQRFEKSQAVERERQDAVHRSAIAWTLYAGDEQLVRNPNTGQMMRVTTKAGTHGHQDEVSGDVVMTDDPTYDPSFYERGQWTQLENVDPMKK
jgi:hypothetical protein